MYAEFCEGEGGNYYWYYLNFRGINLIKLMDNADKSYYKSDTEKQSVSPDRTLQKIQTKNAPITLFHTGSLLSKLQ